MFARFPIPKPIDDALKSINTYLSLATWIKPVFDGLVAVMLGISTYFAESWVPLSIVAFVGGFVALSLLPEALRKARGAPSSMDGEDKSDTNTRNLLLYIIRVEKSRLAAALLDKIVSSTPTIPRIDDRKNFDAKVFAQDVGSSNEYCQRANLTAS
jgi:hypothetical protein